MYVPLDVLLDILDAQNASLARRLNDFRDKSIVSNGLLALHYAHNGSLSLKVSISLDSLVRLFVLFLRFLQLNLVDLDSIPLVAESGIDRKAVSVVDFSSTRILAQRLEFGAG
jgi:hypothetical protein